MTSRLLKKRVMIMATRARWVDHRVPPCDRLGAQDSCLGPAPAASGALSSASLAAAPTFRHAGFGGTGR